MLIRLLSIYLMAFSVLALADEDTSQSNFPPPYTTDTTITGQYYYAYEHFIKDIYITTPINGKFYFKIFSAQTPTHAAMTVQYYNEVDGVATFNPQGVGVYSSPHKNCNLYFFFKPPKLVIEQEKTCGMPAEFGIEARGVYTQLEFF